MADLNALGNTANFSVSKGGQLAPEYPTIMQIEKYIFYLNKTGANGEKRLTEKYKDQLPENLKIKITNPNGMIIMGRDNNLTENQLSDFEIIKRKYKNIIDIFTYDDLIRRIEIMLAQLECI